VIWRPRVLLADDHLLMAEALAKLLEPRCEVVGTVADGHSLLAVARDLRPDVALVDIAMPQLNGLDAGSQLRVTLPGCKLIYLTMSHDPDLAAEAMRRGAAAYLLKTSAGSELLQALDTVLRGRRYIAPSLRAAVEERLRRRPDAARPQLTARQREVLQLLAEGRSMKQVAGVLGLTARTVAFHKYRMMREFDLKSNAELVQFAIRQRVIGAEGADAAV
jgi:DNA-binding NarL/FixJ family response regulator